MSRWKALALLAIVAAPAGAQVTIGLGGGTGVGSRGGSASSAHEVGFVELHLPILPAARFEAINANTTGAGTFSFAVSGVFEVPTPIVRPYVLAGWGTYGIEDKGAASGWNVGAGLRTALLVGPGFFVEVRRHDRIARDLLTFGIRPPTIPAAMPAQTFGARIYRFYTGLEAPRVPAGVCTMHPYRDRITRRLVRAYLDAFYADTAPRLLAFGINPGRFGSGITGVTFTDPVALADFCGIANDLPRRRELSSVFIYQAIERLGGVRAFTRRCFLTAAAPLGFTRRGVNVNYYDMPALARACEPFIVHSVERHLACGGRRDRAIVIGTGKNMAVLSRLNAGHGWFGRLDALDHPRFIMQYRRRRIAEYLDRYVEAFSAA